MIQEALPRPPSPTTPRSTLIRYVTESRRAGLRCVAGRLVCVCVCCGRSWSPGCRGCEGFGPSEPSETRPSERARSNSPGLGLAGPGLAGRGRRGGLCESHFRLLRWVGLVLSPLCRRASVSVLVPRRRIAVLGTFRDAMGLLSSCLGQSAASWVVVGLPAGWMLRRAGN